MTILKSIFIGYLILLLAFWTVAFFNEVVKGIKNYTVRRKDTHVILRNILQLLKDDAFKNAPCDDALDEYGNLGWALCGLLPVEGVTSVADMVRGQEPSLEGGIRAIRGLTQKLDELNKGWYFKLKPRGQQDLVYVNRTIDRIAERG